MSIIDSKLLFSEDVAPGTVAAHDSTNIVDLGIGKDGFDAAVNSNPGAGGQLFLNIVVTTGILASGGAAEVQWGLQHCATVGGSYEATNILTPAIGKATLVKGYVVCSQPLPAGLMEFLKVVCTVTTNNITTGAYSAWIGTEPIQDK